jgi:hypothetical protein
MFKNSLLPFFTLILCFLFIENSYGQANDGCTNCNCSSLFNSCASGKCCPPTYALCTCGVFVSSCGCVSNTGGAGGNFAPSEQLNSTVPNDRLIKDFIGFLSNGTFNSNTSQQLKSQLEAYLSAYQKRDADLFVSSSALVESLATQLPAGEKQRVNNWIQAKGGTHLIP